MHWARKQKKDFFDQQKKEKVNFLPFLFCHHQMCVRFNWCGVLIDKIIIAAVKALAKQLGVNCEWFFNLRKLLSFAVFRSSMMMMMK